MEESIKHKIQQLIFSRFPHTPTSCQQEACEALVNFLYNPNDNATFILKGFAGTGKTSLISALIKIAPLLKIKTQLLAPTGRAAKVLSSYSEQKAYTIHKKIHITSADNFGSMKIVRARNKHSYTLFIVDEASMIGTDPINEAKTDLLTDLIDYVKEGKHCRLLFVGDTAQLPPVGSPESPALNEEYLEYISDLDVSSYQMTQVVRQQEVSGVLHNATIIREKLSELEDGEPFDTPLFSLDGHTDVIQLQGNDLEEILYKEYNDNNQEDVCIITKSNKRANIFNQSIRNRILYREDIINAGDYLMVVKNNYYWPDQDSDIGFIANGDIVEVMSVRKHDELYGFNFVEATLRFVDYPDMPHLDCKLILETLISESPSLTYDEHHKLYQAIMEDYADLPNRGAQITELKKNPYYNALQVKFAYALTCHKTQGGQWKTVIIDQGYLTEEMQNKEYLRWLYTAITRATEKVYLLNFDEKFYK